MQPLIETLMTRFPQTVVSIEADTARSEVTVHVAAERILDIARFLHDAPEASFDHLTDICSVDYPEDRLRFEVVYHLHSLGLHRRLRLKARLSGEDASRLRRSRRIRNAARRRPVQATRARCSNRARGRDTAAEKKA
jgi:NADH-quinone oxidoreductase subunit C/D